MHTPDTTAPVCVNRLSTSPPAEPQADDAWEPLAAPTARVLDRVAAVMTADSGLSRAPDAAGGDGD